VKTLVAGGAGFIGSHLVDRLLAEGHDVDVVDDLSTGSLANLSEARAGRTGRLKIHQLDVRDPSVGDLMEQRRPNVVYGLVAPVGDDPVERAERVVLGGVRLLDGALRCEADKVVFSGGWELYGDRSGSGLPVRESDADAVDTNAAATQALLAYLRGYREAHGVEFTMLAVATAYGPRQRRGLVAESVRRSWAGMDCVVTGDGVQSRDMVFVDDVVDAFVRAADRGSGLVVNVATGIETPVIDVATAVAAAVRAAGGPDVGVAVGASQPTVGPRRVALDSGRARIQLGWSPWTDLADGISQSVEAAAP